MYEVHVYNDTFIRKEIYCLIRKWQKLEKGNRHTNSIICKFAYECESAYKAYDDLKTALVHIAVVLWPIDGLHKFHRTERRKRSSRPGEDCPMSVAQWTISLGRSRGIGYVGCQRSMGSHSWSCQHPRAWRG